MILKSVGFAAFMLHTARRLVGGVMTPPYNGWNYKIYRFFPICKLAVSRQAQQKRLSTQ